MMVLIGDRSIRLGVLIELDLRHSSECFCINLGCHIPSKLFTLRGNPVTDGMTFRVERHV